MSNGEKRIRQKLQLHSFRVDPKPVDKVPKVKSELRKSSVNLEGLALELSSKASLDFEKQATPLSRRRRGGEKRRRAEKASA